MFSQWLSLSGPPWITNEALPLIVHSIPAGWRGGSLQTLSSKRGLDEKFRDVLGFLPGEMTNSAAELSLGPDASIWACDSVVEDFYLRHCARKRACAHGCTWQSSTQKVKVQKKKDSKRAARPGKDRLLISDVLSVLRTDIHNFLCLLHAALFGLMEPSWKPVCLSLTSVGWTAPSWLAPEWLGTSAPALVHKKRDVSAVLVVSKMKCRGIELWRHAHKSTTARLEIKQR